MSHVSPTKHDSAEDTDVRRSERERERQTDRERQRETDRQTDRQTEKERDIHAHRDRETRRGRQKEQKKRRQKETKTENETHRETDMKTTETDSERDSAETELNHSKLWVPGSLYVSHEDKKKKVQTTYRSPGIRVSHLCILIT